MPTDRAGMNGAAVAAAQARHDGTWPCLGCGAPLDKTQAAAGYRLHAWCDDPDNPAELFCRRCRLARGVQAPQTQDRPPGCRCARPDLWRPRALALTV